ncbi:MAG: DUF302 domain-containing protein [Chloroflexota bacterium]
MSTGIGMRAVLSTSFDEAIEKTTMALKAEGFGVLTRIDVHSTLKEKINVDFRKYMILGACSPPLARRALAANADAGLLLPCNVTEQEEGGRMAVAAVNPDQMLGVLKEDPAVSAVAAEAKAKPERVITALKA